MKRKVEETKNPSQVPQTITQKHVLVIVDKKEGTASRKNDATDLITLWDQKILIDHASKGAMLSPLDPPCPSVRRSWVGF